jgi:NAD(P)-dependent dehydrogenase (short-subunit alcohol dehydrogenase family)
MKLQDKVAVVTGGGRGIGRAICLAFADEGANVVIAADVESQVKDVAAEVEARRRKAVAYRVDVVNADEVEGLLKATLAAFGTVDILVNCAGVVGKRAFICDTDDAEWRRVIDVNLFGTYYCIKNFLRVMMRQGEGRIINIASISGKQASPTNAAYSASKHAVIGLTRTVAAEMGLLRLPGITVNAICPGVVDTEMVMGAGGVVDELARILQISREQVVQERVLPMSIQRRLLDPEEIAAAAVYLASPAARGITGQAINVCGGAVTH